MKTAVVVYSLDGSCAVIADEIKAQLNADVIRLQTKDEKKRGKVGSMFWGCAMVFFKKKPLLKPYSFDSSAYDLLIMGAPVWADSPAPPIQTFVTESGITGKKIALFVCHAGGKGKSQQKFKTMLAGNDIISEGDFHTPAKKNADEVKRQVADWIKNFKS